VLDLTETLARELERPRQLSNRVLNYIRQTYGIDYDAIGSFLMDELSRLEEDEVDLILSPVFTPTLADQAVVAELLGGDSVTRDQWPSLIEQLVARPTHAQLADFKGTHRVALHEVAITRYVYRLRLDGAISTTVLKLIDRTPISADRPMLKAIARRAVWESDARNNILERYFMATASPDAYRPADAIELLNTVETVKPASMADLLAWIPRRQDDLREQINVGSVGKPFFSDQIQTMHGGERDQRERSPVGVSAKEAELAFLSRLHRVLMRTPPPG